ncbi:hypothetical protein F4778DRAFT_769767 [Xylariomycetidae sp. FL2044]|nr:hypothetical protein F4778DRAFT_769767 [Xylariomycetidae sp. FL2044]
MSTSKRRKLNVAEPAPAMSAFALRKKFLAQRSTNLLSALDESKNASTQGMPMTTVGSSQTKTLVKTKISRISPIGATSLPDVQAAEDIATPPLSTEAVNQEPALPKPLESLPPSSSSGDDDDDEDENGLALPTAAPVVQFSSFSPSKSNYHKRKDGTLILKLCEGERLVILGSYDVLVKSGEITINGATLKNTKKLHSVDAPHCHALPVIRCSEDATLEIHSSSRVEGLRNLGTLSPLFRKLWNDSREAGEGVASTFQILYKSSDGPKKTVLQDLISPPEWNKELAKLLNNSKSSPMSIMITGPKSSGKSTFGKILANRLLTTSTASNHTKRRSQNGVVVLDLDPGQPEYCISGQVALVLVREPILSPSFCRPIATSGLRIVRSHTLASVSPASDPDLYLEAAMDLMTHYRNHLGSYPLIINTPGWIQGTGLDLLVSLILSLRPNEVVYMSQTGPAEAVEALQEVCVKSVFTTLPSQATQNTLRTAAHLRFMQMMSYFHAEVDRSSVETRWNTTPLTTIPPWEVSYTGVNSGILGILCYDYQAPPELLADAINGTILAVVEVESDKAFRKLCGRTGNTGVDLNESMMDIDDAEGIESAAMASTSRLKGAITYTTPEGIPFIDATDGITLDPRYSHCIGLVLVRGIDVENGVLQLLIPIPIEKIEDINSKGGQIVLVSGKFDAPSWAYTEELYYRSGEEVREEEGFEDSTADNSSSSSSSSSESNSEDDGTEQQSFGRNADAYSTETPWIEVFHGNQKRGAGSKVWRVRRDLGRQMGSAAE